MKRLALLSLIALVLMACKKDDDDSAPGFKGGTKYTVTFNIDWNSTDFPMNYPSNAHFSKLIGWSHASNDSFFKTGSTASPGIINMAQTGETSPLDNEFMNLISEGRGYNYFIGSNISSGTGQIVLKIEVTEEFPSVTLATMVAPSPDWYIAVVDINLLENNAFVDQKTVDAHVYDAGSDDGISYTSADKASNPQQPITVFVDAPLGNGTMLNANIASVTFTKD